MQGFVGFVEGQGEEVVVDDTHGTNAADGVAFSPFGNNLGKIAISDMVTSDGEVSRDMVDNTTVVIVDKFNGRLVGNARSPSINAREDSNVDIEESRVDTAVHIVVELFDSESEVVRKSTVREDEEGVFITETFRFAEVDDIFRMKIMTVHTNSLGLVGNEEVGTTVANDNFIGNEESEFKVVHKEVITITMLVADLVGRSIHVGNSLEFNGKNRVGRDHLRDLITFEREELEGVFFNTASRFAADEHNFARTQFRIVSSDFELNSFRIETTEQDRVSTVEVGVESVHQLDDGDGSESNALFTRNLVTSVPGIDSTFFEVVGTEELESVLGSVEGNIHTSGHTITFSDEDEIVAVATITNNLHGLFNTRDNMVGGESREINNLDSEVGNLEGRFFIISIHNTGMEEGRSRVLLESNIDEVLTFGFFVDGGITVFSGEFTFAVIDVHHHTRSSALFIFEDELEIDLIPAVNTANVQLLLHVHDGSIARIPFRIVVDGNVQDFQGVFIITLPLFITELVAENVGRVGFTGQFGESNSELHGNIEFNNTGGNNITSIHARAVAAALHILDTIALANTRTSNFNHLLGIAESTVGGGDRVESSNILHQHGIGVVSSSFFVDEVVAEEQVVVIRVFVEGDGRLLVSHGEAVGAVGRTFISRRGESENIEIRDTGGGTEVENLFLTNDDRSRTTHFSLRRGDVSDLNGQIGEEENVALLVHIEVLGELVASTVNTGSLHIGRLGVEDESGHAVDNRETELEVRIEFSFAFLAGRSEVDNIFIDAVFTVQSEGLGMGGDDTVISTLVSDEIAELVDSEDVFIELVEVFTFELEAKMTNSRHVTIVVDDEFALHVHGEDGTVSIARFFRSNKLNVFLHGGDGGEIRDSGSQTILVMTHNSKGLSSGLFVTFNEDELL